MWRLLGALEGNGLLQRDHAGAFRPGSLFVRYAARPSAVHDLAELARPTLERLGELTEETVALAVARGNELVELAQVESRHLLGAAHRPDRADAAALHGAGQGAARLRRAGAAGRGAGAAHPVLAGGPGGAGRGSWPRCAGSAGRRRSTSWRWGWPGWPRRSERSDGAVLAAVSVSGPTARIADRGVGALGELLLAELRTCRNSWATGAGMINP